MTFNGITLAAQHTRRDHDEPIYTIVTNADGVMVRTRHHDVGALSICLAANSLRALAGVYGVITVTGDPNGADIWCRCWIKTAGADVVVFDGVTMPRHGWLGSAFQRRQSSGNYTALDWPARNVANT